MPILWIQQQSPLTITVLDDDGTEIDSLTVSGVNGRDAVWRIKELANERPENPVYDKGFQMKSDDDGGALLKIEIDELEGGGGAQGS